MLQLATSAIAAFARFLPPPFSWKKRAPLSLVFACPADDWLLDPGRHSVRLIFNQPIDRDRSYLFLKPMCGTLELIPARGDRPIDAIWATLVATIPGLYTLEWTVRVPDGREAAGVIRFYIESR